MEASRQHGESHGAVGAAIELDPSFEETYFRLAALHAEAKNPAKARQALERYLKVMPNSVAARTALR